MMPGSSERAQRLGAELEDFMERHVLPAERVYREQLKAADDPHALPPVVEELKAEARRRGLWNLFLPDDRWGAGLTNLEYAPLAEITGHSITLAPEALNCSAPDTGNMELLVHYGTRAQQDRWLTGLLEGEIRSAFCMTEPEVASSDATNIATTIVADGDDYVIDGRKWWSSGTADPRCKLGIVMGLTDPDGPPHARHSMVLVPLDAPGVEVVRDLSIFGYVEQHGHGEVVFDDVRVPRENLLGQEGAGFAIAQARLGPGRIHHCMRAIGLAERALDLMIDRARSRVAFGGPLSDQGVIQGYIAESRIELDQARLLVLHTASMMDTVGNRAARTEIAAIKVVAARVAMQVIDRAIQVFGAGGLCEDFPLAHAYAHARLLRLADGPDEVHLRTVARQELKRRAKAVPDAAPVAAGWFGGVPR
ncbi:MAG: acyl-CoA dehydrogenase family protein [Solirubrobacteraceae bacterium]